MLKDLRLKKYNIIIGKNFYDQPIGSKIKWYQKIRKLTTGQGEDYTTGCLLDYGYIKNHYKLIAVDLSRQKVLDVDPKAIPQIKFIGQLKKYRSWSYKCWWNTKYVILMILEKNKEARLIFFQGRVTVL